MGGRAAARTELQGINLEEGEGGGEGTPWGGVRKPGRLV